jgi:hypothetical protein
MEELNHSWKAASRSATQEFYDILGNPNVHYRVHKSRLSVTILSQISLVHITPSCLSILILSSNLRIILPNGLISFWLSHQNLIRIPLLPHECYMNCPSHSRWLDHSNNTCRKVQVIPPVTSSLCVPNILFSILFLNTISPCSSLHVRDLVSHQYKIPSKIIVLYILLFTFLDSRREDKGLWTKW